MISAAGLNTKIKSEFIKKSNDLSSEIEYPNRAGVGFHIHLNQEIGLNWKAYQLAIMMDILISLFFFGTSYGF